MKRFRITAFDAGGDVVGESEGPVFQLIPWISRLLAGDEVPREFHVEEVES